MGYKLLIADDDPMIRAVLSKVAVSRGHTVVACADGAQAIGMALAERPDGVMLDLMMPNLDGRDVIARLKSDPSTCETPILMLTAVDDEFTRELCLEYGVADYVLKPFDLNHVFMKMEHLIEKARETKATT
jgi:DNA-binding response OmpR family regulator